MMFLSISEVAFGLAAVGCDGLGECRRRVHSGFSSMIQSRASCEYVCFGYNKNKK